MGATIHDIWSIALPKRLQAPEDDSQRTLCNHGSITPFVVREEQRVSGLLLSTQATPDAGPSLHETSAAVGALRAKKDRIRKSARFLASLRTCTTNNDLHRGSKIHDTVSAMGLLAECSDSLVIMYAKCGALAKAQELLDMYDSRDVFSWTALIAGYARQGQSQDAMMCFEQMKRKGLSPDAVTFACVLKACGKLGAVDKGKQIHDEIMRQGMLGKHVVLGTALVHMYAKCGALAKAQRVLEELPRRNVITWGVLIAGYVQFGQAEQAWKCFECMQREGIAPNAMSFTCVLKACANLRAVNKGVAVHDKISRQGLLRGNVVLGNALVDMYAKCGALEKAKSVLEELSPRNIITWNTLIAGYAEQGQGEQALTSFERMQGDGFSPDAVTYASILKACSSQGDIDIGKQIHDRIAREGLLQNDDILGTALVDMYAKCGDLAKARDALVGLSSRNVICWSALIAGYAHQGHGEEAWTCFECMKREGIHPNAVTFACILKACGTLAALNRGIEIHEEIAKKGLLRNNVVLGNALVDMYAKCGALAMAQQALEELPSRDVISWNTLITGYTQQGQGEQAMRCFERMQQEGIPPDIVTFSCVLCVCSHLGLVEDGHMHFMSMNTKYGLKPNLELYTCMIDMFGRAGHLQKALGVIQEMPSSDSSAAWHATLAACLKWGDVNVGRWAFEQAVQVDKSDVSAYVLMANIYGAAGMPEKAKDIDAMRMEIDYERCHLNAS